jgi:hypothetical protein
MVYVVHVVYVVSGLALLQQNVAKNKESLRTLKTLKAMAEA